MHYSFSRYEDFGVEIWVLLEVFFDLNKWLQDLSRQWMLLNAWISPLSSPSFGFSIVVCEDCSSLWFSKLLFFIQAIWPLRPKIEPLEVMWLKIQGWKTSYFYLLAMFESARSPSSRLAWCFELARMDYTDFLTLLESALPSSSRLRWTVQTFLLCLSQLSLLQVSSNVLFNKS